MFRDKMRHTPKYVAESARNKPSVTLSSHRMATPAHLWLCGYDLPASPAGRRVQFYRLKKRLIKESRIQNSEIAWPGRIRIASCYSA